MPRHGRVIKKRRPRHLAHRMKRLGRAVRARKKMLRSSQEEHLQ